VKKILVVDDENRFRALVVEMLKRGGYETIEAENGVEAFELAKTLKPDLVLSDVMMYSGSGFILHELLKRDPTTAHIPLILMSAFAEKATGWGSDPNVVYLAKPFSMDDLFEAVKRKLER